MDELLHLVIGLGKTGHSIARYLQRRNIDFAVFDTRNAVHGIDEFKQNFPGIDIYLGDLPRDIYKKILTVIVSPGVDCNLPIIQKIKSLGIPIYGDIECFAQEVSSPVIAITGTNGKSTVTSLVGEMAKNFDISVGVAGNIGTPVLDLLDDDQQYGLWVLELSSFQLELTSSLQPLASTILNISPDHLDRHSDFNSYILAKQRIYTKTACYVYNREDKLTMPLDMQNIPKDMLISYGLDAPQEGDWGLRELNGELHLAYGMENIMPISAARLKGKHNWLNMLAASALAHAAGISYNAIRNSLQEFRSLPHRCEFIRNLNGVDWIDDSKGTNVGATIAALNGLGESIKGKIVLIAGGQGKGADFTELRDSVSKFVKSVIVIGEDANLLTTALSDITTVIQSEKIQDAVNIARDVAKNGDMVLLSPACASLDMFRDFNHRGEVFTEAVENL